MDSSDKAAVEETMETMWAYHRAAAEAINKDEFQDCSFGYIHYRYKMHIIDVFENWCIGQENDTETIRNK